MMVEDLKNATSSSSTSSEDVAVGSADNSLPSLPLRPTLRPSAFPLLIDNCWGSQEC